MLAAQPAAVCQLSAGSGAGPAGEVLAHQVSIERACGAVIRQNRPGISEIDPQHGRQCHRGYLLQANDHVPGVPRLHRGGGEHRKPMMRACSAAAPSCADLPIPGSPISTTGRPAAYILPSRSVSTWASRGLPVSAEAVVADHIPRQLPASAELSALAAGCRPGGGDPALCQPTECSAGSAWRGAHGPVNVRSSPHSRPGSRMTEAQRMRLHDDAGEPRSPQGGKRS